VIRTFIEKLVLDRDNNIKNNGDFKFNNLKLEYIQILKNTKNNIRLFVIIYLN
jgi:hypothetical protein